MVRLRLALCVVVVLTLAVTISLGASAANPQPDGCPTDKPQVVNAYAMIRNTLDFGADGHVWALDQITNTVQIWRLGGDAYCVKVHSVGTSTTFAGVSPEGTGFVRAGVTASIDGYWYERINGKFAPTLPTTGLIGIYDDQCSQDGTCASYAPSVAAAYFSTVAHDDFGAYGFTADAGPVCGVWHQSSSGDTGDILC